MAAILLASLFLLFGCGIGVCDVLITVANVSGFEVTDVRLLLANNITINKFNDGQKITCTFSWSITGSQKPDYVSNAHIEYAINEKKYDHTNEQGVFAGKSIVLISKDDVLITIYADHYTLETM
jgi:lipid-binding SYLF domain-containing protein